MRAVSASTFRYKLLTMNLPRHLPGKAINSEKPYNVLNSDSFLGRVRSRSSRVEAIRIKDKSRCLTEMQVGITACIQEVPTLLHHSFVRQNDNNSAIDTD
jgi:hypothetical protein